MERALQQWRQLDLDLTIDWQRIISSLVCALLAMLAFAACFGLLGIFFEGVVFNMSAVYIGGLSFFVIDLLFATLIDLFGRYTPAERAAIQAAKHNMESLPDEGDRIAFHWSVSHGILVTFMVATMYVAISYFLSLEVMAYVFLIIAVTPFSPWIGALALDYNKKLMGRRSFTKMMLHLTRS